MKAKHGLARPITSVQGSFAVNQHPTSIVVLASVITGLALLAFAPLQSAYTQSIAVDRTDGLAVVISLVGAAVGAVANDCSLPGVVFSTNDHLGTTINLPAGAYQSTIARALKVGNCHEEKTGDLRIDGANTGIVTTGIASTND